MKLIVCLVYWVLKRLSDEEVEKIQIKIGLFVAAWAPKRSFRNHFLKYFTDDMRIFFKL